jgi:hypothetical protein
VEKASGSDLLLSDGFLLQVNSSNNTFASCKSLVSKPLGEPAVDLGQQQPRFVLLTLLLL